MLVNFRPLQMPLPGLFQLILASGRQRRNMQMLLRWIQTGTPRLDLYSAFGGYVHLSLWQGKGVSLRRIHSRSHCPAWAFEARRRMLLRREGCELSPVPPGGAAVCLVIGRREDRVESSSVSGSPVEGALDAKGPPDRKKRSPGETTLPAPP